MSVIADKASEIQDSYQSHDVSRTLRASAIDIGGIIGIISSLLGMLMNCGKTPTQAARIMKRTGPLERARINMIIKDRLGTADKRLAASVQKVAARCSQREVATMYGEVSPE